MVSKFNLFDLSQWKLTLPIDTRGGWHGRALDIRDVSDFRDPHYFHVGADGGMVFEAPVYGATTPNSTRARSELREMIDGTEAAWQLKQGGTMTATLAVNRVPTLLDGTPARVVIGQIHGRSQELVRLYYDNGTVYFRDDQTGLFNHQATYYLADAHGRAPDIDPGETFSYKIEARGSRLSVTVYADGETYSATVHVSSVWQADHFYFKAGLYLGANETAATGSGEAVFYGLDFGHAPGEGLGGLTHAAPGSGVDAEGTNTGDALGGSAQADMLNGHNGNDSLNGGDSRDLLWGGGGADRLNGGSGADRLIGGDGQDMYVVDNRHDHVVEYSHAGHGGADTVFASVSYGLPGHVENLVLTGGEASKAVGNDEANSLTGNFADNRLTGGLGADTLTGHGGKDQFVFDSPVHKGEADTITDFQPGYDKLLLDHAVFGALTPGHLAVTQFRQSGPHTTDQHLVYNDMTGVLYYDRDGSGGAKPVALVHLDGAPALTAFDILIV